MRRTELTKAVVDILKENNQRKTLPSQKAVFHISGEDGSGKDFIVRHSGASVPFAKRDVECVLDAVASVIEDSIARGKSVTLTGFGTFFLKYRGTTWTTHPITGSKVPIPGHYMVKFRVGPALKRSAKLYGVSVEAGEFADSDGSGTAAPEDGDE